MQKKQTNVYFLQRLRIFAVIFNLQLTILTISDILINNLKYIIMKLFYNPMKEWEKTMTENELDQMEAQGNDVSVYREKLAARRAQEAEQAKRDREM